MLLLMNPSSELAKKALFSGQDTAEWRQLNGEVKRNKYEKERLTFLVSTMASARLRPTPCSVDSSSTVATLMSTRWRCWRPPRCDPAASQPCAIPRVVLEVSGGGIRGPAGVAMSVFSPSYRHLMDHQCINLSDHFLERRGERGEGGDLEIQT